MSQALPSDVCETGCDFKVQACTEEPGVEPTATARTGTTGGVRGCSAVATSSVSIGNTAAMVVSLAG